MQFEHPVKIETDQWIGEQIGCQAFKVAISDDDLFAREETSLPNDGSARVFAYAKIPVSEQRALNYLIAKGFYFVETTVLYVKPVAVVAEFEPADFRFLDADAMDTEINALSALAQETFVYGDFHVDPIVGDSVARRIRDQWVRNYFRGTRGTHMIVSKSDEEFNGFLLLAVSPPNITIDLIAVRGRDQGQGIASKLIRYAEKSFPECERISAGTQISNSPSIGLYSKLGFVFSQATYALHYYSDGVVSS